MPHLRIETSHDLPERVDLSAFCAHMRDAMVATGVFPIGGIRVRAYPAAFEAVADGLEPYGFADLMVRMGEGRTEAVRAQTAESLYGAAEAFLQPRLGAFPFALSLEVVQITSVYSIKRYSTIHAHLSARDQGD